MSGVFGADPGENLVLWALYSGVGHSYWSELATPEVVVPEFAVCAFALSMSLELNESTTNKDEINNVKRKVVSRLFCDIFQWKNINDSISSAVLSVYKNV